MIQLHGICWPKNPVPRRQVRKHIGLTSKHGSDSTLKTSQNYPTYFSWMQYVISRNLEPLYFWNDNIISRSVTQSAHPSPWETELRPLTWSRSTLFRRTATGQNVGSGTMVDTYIDMYIYIYIISCIFILSYISLQKLEKYVYLFITIHVYNVYVYV